MAVILTEGAVHCCGTQGMLSRREGSPR